MTKDQLKRTYPAGHKGSCLCGPCMDVFRWNDFIDQLYKLDYMIVHQTQLGAWQFVETCPNDGSPIWAAQQVVHDELVVIRETAKGDFFRSGKNGPGYPIKYWMPRNEKAPVPPKE